MRVRALLAAALALTALASPAAAAEARAPVIEQLVVFRSGEALTKRVSTRRRAGARRRAPLRGRGRHGAGGAGPQPAGPAADPRLRRLLAASAGRRGPVRRGDPVRSKPGPERLGLQGRQARRHGGRRRPLRAVRARAAARRAAGHLVLLPASSAAAASARSSCGSTRSRAGSWPRCAAMTTRVAGVAIEGATVRAGSATAVTAADGRVRLAASPGAHRVTATKDGLVRSFAERVEVP